MPYQNCEGNYIYLNNTYHGSLAYSSILYFVSSSAAVASFFFFFNILGWQQATLVHDRHLVVGNDNLFRLVSQAPAITEEHIKDGRILIALQKTKNAGSKAFWGPWNSMSLGNKLLLC